MEVSRVINVHDFSFYNRVEFWLGMVSWIFFVKVFLGDVFDVFFWGSFFIVMVWCEGI